MVNPFVGTPVGDYVRDAAAVVLLFAMLGKPWDIDGDASGHWWVVLSALVAVASVAVPYVAKARAVPGLGPDQALLLKLGLNVPLLVSAFAAVVNDLVHATDFLDGGIGSAVGIALTGCALAVQPRAADDDAHHRDDPRWWAATTTVTAAAIVLPVVTFVAYVLRDLTGDGFLLDEPVFFLTLVVGVLVLTLVLLGWPGSSVLGRHFPGLLTLATVGFTFVVVDLLTTGDGLFGGTYVSRWDSPGGGLILVGAAAALAVSRPALRTVTAPHHPVHPWLLTGRLALQVAALGSIVLALAYVLEMVSREEVLAVLVISVVLLGVSAALCLVAASLLTAATLNRLTFVSLAAAPAVLGVIVTAVLHSSDLGVLLSSQSAATLLTLPLLAVAALTAPGIVRRTYGPLLPERQPPAPGPYQQGQPPFSGTP
jgi:hypothetical protein